MMISIAALYMMFLYMTVSFLAFIAVFVALIMRDERKKKSQEHSANAGH